MKSTYQLDSALELTPEIIEAIQKAYGDQAINITIESKATRRKSSMKNKLIKQNKKVDTSLAESVIDIILDQLNKPKTKK